MGAGGDVGGSGKIGCKYCAYESGVIVIEPNVLELAASVHFHQSVEA